MENTPTTEQVQATLREEVAKDIAEAAAKKDRVKWSFDPESRLASMVIGIKAESYDLSNIIPMTATMNEKALSFFGYKQWISSNFASFKDDEGKITSAREDYNDLINSGLELVQGEKGVTFMKVVGKATTKGDRASVSKAHLNSQVWSLVELKTLQKAKVPFTPEMTKVLAELEAEVSKQNEINALTKKGKK